MPKAVYVPTARDGYAMTREESVRTAIGERYPLPTITEATTLHLVVICLSSGGTLECRLPANEAKKRFYQEIKRKDVVSVSIYYHGYIQEAYAVVSRDHTFYHWEKNIMRCLSNDLISEYEWIHAPRRSLEEFIIWLRQEGAQE